MDVITSQPYALVVAFIVIALTSLLFLITKKKIALNKDTWIPFKLIEKEVLINRLRSNPSIEICIKLSIYRTSVY